MPEADKNKIRRKPTELGGRAGSQERRRGKVLALSVHTSKTLFAVVSSATHVPSGGFWQLMSACACAFGQRGQEKNEMPGCVFTTRWIRCVLHHSLP